jgi:hypothetical protein
MTASAHRLRREAVHVDRETSAPLKRSQAVARAVQSSEMFRASTLASLR